MKRLRPIGWNQCPFTTHQNSRPVLWPNRKLWQRNGNVTNHHPNYAVIDRWHSKGLGVTVRSISSTLTTQSTSKKIAIAMSGGVDSSVVAYLLSKQYSTDELIGIHMSNWDFHDEDPAISTAMKRNKNDSFCWEQDLKDANAVGTYLNIPMHHISFQAEYWNDVFQPYCNQLSQSITPNPDVDCNRYIKFGALKEYLKKRFAGDVDRIATGHYARIWDRSNSNTTRMNLLTGESGTKINGIPNYLEQALEEEQSPVLADYILHSSVADRPILFSARDCSKDQSYFLSGVPAAAFAGVLFPLGDLYKTEQEKKYFEGEKNDKSFDYAELSVRQLAQHAKLPNATKKDSVGICFIGKRKHGEFISEYVDNPVDHMGKAYSSSPVVDCINIENNEVVSKFDPIENPSLTYATIGQGAKLSGAHQKWFVVDKQLRPPSSRRKPTTKTDQEWKAPRIFICPGTHHPSLYTDRFYISSNLFNWMAGGGDANRPPPLPFNAKCRIRHLQPLVACEIRHSTFSEIGDYFEVKTKIPLRGLHLGKFA